MGPAMVVRTGIEKDGGMSVSLRTGVENDDICYEQSVWGLRTSGV